MKHKWIIAVIIATVAVALLFGNTYLFKPKYSSVILLYNPEDDAVLYGGKVNFSFYVDTDAPTPQVCLMVKNPTGIWEFEIYDLGWLNITKTFRNGTYTWWVEIYTPSTTTPGAWTRIAKSETRTFTVVEYVPPPPSPQSPVINYFGCPERAKVGEKVTFVVSAYDPDGEIKYNIFDFGDGESLLTSSSTATHIYHTAGEYNVSVTVVDDDGLQTTAKRVIEVYGEPVTPEPEKPATNYALVYSMVAIFGIIGLVIVFKKM